MAERTNEKNDLKGKYTISVNGPGIDMTIKEGRNPEGLNVIRIEKNIWADTGPVNAIYDTENYTVHHYESTDRHVDFDGNNPTYFKITGITVKNDGGSIMYDLENSRIFYREAYAGGFWGGKEGSLAVGLFKFRKHGEVENGVPAPSIYALIEAYTKIKRTAIGNSGWKAVSTSLNFKVGATGNKEEIKSAIENATSVDAHIPLLERIKNVLRGKKGIPEGITLSSEEADGLLRANNAMR